MHPTPDLFRQAKVRGQQLTSKSLWRLIQTDSSTRSCVKQVWGELGIIQVIRIRINTNARARAWTAPGSLPYWSSLGDWEVAPTRSSTAWQRPNGVQTKIGGRGISCTGCGGSSGLSYLIQARIRRGGEGLQTAHGRYRDRHQDSRLQLQSGHRRCGVGAVRGLPKTGPPDERVWSGEAVA